MKIMMQVCRRLLPLFAVLSTAMAANAALAEPGVSAKEVTIGMWAPLTGPTALLGTSERDAIQIAIDQVNAAGGINGRTLRLIAYDDGGSPQEALASVRRLVLQDRVFALIAGSVSGSTLPVMPLIGQWKVPFLAAISSNRNLLQPFSHYGFRVYANETAQAQSLMKFALKQGFKRPAMIYTSNDYGIGGEQAIEGGLAQAGLKLVDRERYNDGDQDFTSQLLRVKQSGADALFVWAFAADAGIIVREARQIGLTIPMFGGGGTATPLFPKAAGAAGTGFMASFVTPDLPESSTLPPIAAYRQALTAHYKGDLPPGRPSEYDLAGYGALKIFAEALRRAGPEPTREKLVAALESLRDFGTGVLFPVTFTAQDHEGTNQVSVVRVAPSLKWEVVK